MADYKLTAALNAASIPTLSRSQPRSVVIGQLDGRLKNPASSNTDNADNNPANVPQLLYAENVLPTREGIISVGYINQGDVFPAGGTADEVFTIYNKSDGAPAMLSPALGKNFIKALATDAWVSYAFAGVPIARRVSTAYVNGVSYVCYEGTIIGHWDNTIPNMVDDSGTLTGLAVGNMRSICASGNYLIAITGTNEIAWSSLTNPLDFVPSITSGAGRQTPVDMKGIPLALTSLSGGFLIHCTQNVIAAVYTQNAAQPWIFREVKGAGGVSSSALSGIAKNNNATAVYAHTTYGIQSLNLRDSDILHADVADYLATGIIEAFDSATKLLSISTLAASNISVKLAILGNRYLMLSFGSDGAGSWTHALIYDMELRRWGKLKITHVSLFHFGVQDATPHDFFYVLLKSGQLKKVVISPGIADSAVAILGRYQISRGTKTCSQELELELLNAADVVTVNLATNYNGTTLGEVGPMFLNETTDNYRLFQKQSEGENLSYIIEGTFHLATALLTVTKGSKY